MIAQFHFFENLDNFGKQLKKFNVKTPIKSHGSFWATKINSGTNFLKLFTPWYDPQLHKLEQIWDLTNKPNLGAMKQGRGMCGTFQSFYQRYHARTTFIDTYIDGSRSVDRLKFARVDVGNVSKKGKIWKVLLLEVFLLVVF